MDVLRECRSMFSPALSVWTARRLAVQWGSPSIVPARSWLPMMSATAYGESDPRLKKRQRNPESARLTRLESPRSRRCRNEMCSQTPEPARHRSEKLHDSTLSYERLAAAAFQSGVRLAGR